MISLKIIDSARFIKMPISTQAFYFHLIARADDDGVVEAFNVMRTLGTSEDDLKVLISKGYVEVLNEDLVTFIMDWHEHNLIRSDRKVDSVYKPLLLQIIPDLRLVESTVRADRKGVVGTSRGRPLDNHGTAEDRLGKVRLGKVSEESGEKFIPPTLEELKIYHADHNMTFDVQKFFDFFTEGDWYDSKGNKVRNWKQKMITWQNQEKPSAAQTKKKYTIEKESKYTEDELEEILLNKAMGKNHERNM